MFSKSGLFIFCSVVAFLAPNEAAEYNYGAQAKWYDEFDECSLWRQSPIELNSNDATIVTDMPEISFEHYDTTYTEPARCENTGYTVNIQLPKPKGHNASLCEIYDPTTPYITGGPLAPTSKYIAESLHFHWGSKNGHGSEHVIDGQRYSMEMHVVHRNINYSSVGEASKHEDGLTVLGILFKVENELTRDFLGLNPIIDALHFVGKYNETAESKNFTLSTLLTSLQKDEFFTYGGSLTTPPCSQAVTWIVYSNPILISPAQMERFREISDKYDAVLENNYRSLQAKGNRKVFLRQMLKEEEFFPKFEWLRTLNMH